MAKPLPKREQIRLTIDIYVHDIFYKTITAPVKLMGIGLLTQAAVHAEVERQCSELQGERFRVFYSLPQYYKKELQSKFF